MANQHSGWTATELDLLRQIYPVSGPKAAARVLPGRTLDTIRKRANLMKLRRLRADGTPRAPRAKAGRVEPYRLAPEPLSDLDRIALREWGTVSWSGRFRPLRPMVRVELEAAA